MENQDKKFVHNNNNILTGLPIMYPYTKGIGETLFEIMKDAKCKTAQIDGPTGEKDSYEALTKRCVRTAITMRSKGLTSNDIVTICSSNHINTCVPMMASFFLGIQIANTDPCLSLTETTYLIKQVRPKMVFASENAVNLIENALKDCGICAEIVVFGETTKHTPFSEFLIETTEESEFVPAEVDVNKTALILFSSGSTGLPKGICLNHKTLLYHSTVLKKVYSQANTIILSTSPPFWVTQVLLLLNSIISKTCRLLVPDMTAEYTWQLIDNYKVTMLLISPSRVVLMCNHGKPKDVDASSLRLLTFAGSPFSEATVNEARKLLPNSLVFPGYGMTELGGWATHFQITNEDDMKLALQKVMSSGQPVPGVSLKVVDIDTGTILGPNKEGEIRIKTEYQMNGYYNLDASKEWDEDGYLKTGDLGYYDDDCYVYITDRLKEMLKFQGWHISPVKLEEILMSHPAVETALVIGIPHPIDCEHPMGLVSFKESHKTVIQAEEIEKYVNDQVDNIHKLRAGVKIVTKFPMTSSGKYKRKHIKDLVLSGKL